MKIRRLPQVLSGAVFCFTAGFIALMSIVTTPGYTDDMFELKLDAGIGSTNSILENQGYSVHIRKDLTYIRLSSIEIFNFKNAYLIKAHVWINSYKGRVYGYKWDSVIKADQSGAAHIQRLLQHISSKFGKPEVPYGMESRGKKIDASLLKTIVTGGGSEALHLIWKTDTEQIALFLSAPLLPLNDMDVEVTLRYFLPRVEKEVSAYKYGK